jgi:EAL domain-containing protein (putative c-di-GMP-specific phosphodiesterase class I)/DNA-binding NarL/FixJ family response regulator
VAEIVRTKAHVLIIDDEPEIRNVLHEFLSGSYQCASVSSAEEALALISTKRFDLIISDITMERMSGLEMVPHILKVAPQTIVVMISGQQTIEYAIAAMRAGAFDYVMKPFDLRHVDAAVCRALEHRKLLEKKQLCEKTLYTSDMNARAFKRPALELSLRRAVENEEFVVHYQTQVDIESREIVGTEALVRWQHPQLGLLPPADFIGLAEKTGLIVDIGESVMRAACVQTRRWQVQAFRDLHIAVNVSARQLKQKDFVFRLVEILDESELDPVSVELELTETSIMENPESTAKLLADIRRMGMKIAIDDFGTGYSSLSYLKRLPIDTVKLDRSFVNGATAHPDHAALVMAIITLAHNLRLRVIAEGVETEEQLNFLRLLRCDQGQGYLFGKPTPADLIKPLAAGCLDRAPIAQQCQTVIGPNSMQAISC